MKKLILLQGIACALLLSGCAPKITSNLAKTYKPLSVDAPVEVYSAQGKVPVDAEVMGEVSVKDGGATTKCDSLTVINHIKDEARKAGGNAVLILKHTKPSIWGSSCHQMVASVLNVSDFSNLADSEDTEEIVEGTEYQKRLAVANVALKKERLLPRFSLSANIGYGWRTAKTSDALQGWERDYYSKLKRGPVWDLSANYYFNDNYGLGLIYAAFSSGNEEMATNTDTNQSGMLKTDDKINFAGPAFLTRYSMRDKWMFIGNIGIGYIGYSSKMNFLSDKTTTSGASVGLLYELGVECKISENWGVGAKVSAVSGILNSMTIDRNGSKQHLELSKDEREGLATIRLLLGVRYYFK